MDTPLTEVQTLYVIAAGIALFLLGMIAIGVNRR